MVLLSDSAHADEAKDPDWPEAPPYTRASNAFRKVSHVVQFSFRGFRLFVVPRLAPQSLSRQSRVSLFVTEPGVTPGCWAVAGQLPEQLLSQSSRSEKKELDPSNGMSPIPA